MENAITSQEQMGLVSVLSANALADVIKPLTREIHLFDSYIAGTSHLEDPSLPDSVNAGDRLLLRREDNKFDDHAILILNQDQKKLGYVPEKDNLIFARLLDAGKVFEARVKQIRQKGTFTYIGIGIYLIDF